MAKQTRLDADLEAQLGVGPTWEEHLGVLLSEPEAAQRLGAASPQVVRDLVSRGELVGLCRGGQRLFPAFQFSGNRPLPGLGRVLRTLRDGGETSDWTLASWFRSPQAELAGRTPAEALASQHPADHGSVVLCARRTAALLAR